MFELRHFCWIRILSSELIRDNFINYSLKFFVFKKLNFQVKRSESSALFPFCDHVDDDIKNAHLPANHRISGKNEIHVYS